MELDTSVVDTEGTPIEATSQPETPEKNQEVQDAQPTQSTAEQIRKWKLKVNGEELDLTEPEVLKYAQLGKAGQRAMEKAAAVEKKHKELYAQLVAVAEKDPSLLAEVLTGRKRSQAAPQRQATAQESSEIDPRDEKLSFLEEKLLRLEQSREQEELERERQAISNELDSAVKKYPELDSPYLKHFVKAEYRKALINGVDLSLEDVAFYVHQDFKRAEAAKQKATQKKQEELNNRAPVITEASGAAPKKKGTLEDSFKLAGLMPS